MATQLKKYTIITLAVCLVFTLYACGNHQETPVSDSSISSSGLSEGADNTESEGPSLESQEEPSTTEESSVSEETTDTEDSVQEDTLNIQIGDTVLTAELADNSSAEALADLLSDGPLTLELQDYGNMEKVGPIGADLPRNDEQITTEAGDIILYQGNSLVIYYAPNSWNFTRLGKINDLSESELREVLGDGSVTVTLSIGQNA